VIRGVSAAAGIDLRVEGAVAPRTIEWIEPGRVLLSRRNDLYESTALDAAPRHIGAFPAPWWSRTAARLRQGQRALRFMYYNVVPLRDGSIFLSFAKSVGVWRDGAITPLHGIARPCRILRSGAAMASDGAVYFGEYIDYVGSSDMRVYRYCAGGDEVEVAHTFAPGQVHHIHGIHTDPYDGSLWCLSGDVKGECRVMRSADGFRTMDTIGSGDESWRAVSVQFSDDAVFYATDAEFTQNYIMRIDRRSGARTKLVPVGGPGFYSCVAAGQIFFAVTAELCPSQREPMAELWCVDPASGDCRRIVTLRKDLYSVRYFMTGSIDFARGPGDGKRIFFRATALAGDNRTFSVALPARPMST
jgi:hypothetical protein